jgi:HAD superfamily phosphatase (TIGR01668 family)
MRRLLEMCRPDESVSRVTQIDAERLISQGFEAILADLDNTLLPWKSSEVPPDVEEWVERAKASGMKLCIVSNTHNLRRLKRIADELGIESVDRALKPRRAGFARAAERLGCAKERAVVVGDQVLTDVLGGKLAGMHTILVERMDPTEFVGTKISRMIERVVLRMLGLRV